MNVKRIEGRLLNFWVAKSAGLRLSDENPAPGKCHDPESGLWHPHTYNPANDWSHGGALVLCRWHPDAKGNNGKLTQVTPLPPARSVV